MVFFGFLLLFVLLYGDVLFGGMTFFRRDISRFYYPMWNFGVHSFRSGTVPLWNPYVNFGQPFLGNVQTCVFYPLMTVFQFMEFIRAFNFFIILHLALSGLFSYLWGRECGLSRPASILTGAAYSMSGYMMSAVNLTIALASATYFPLALLCFHRALKVRGFFWKSITGICLTFQYLAGDPSILVGTTLVLGIFGLYISLRDSLSSRRLRLMPVGALLQVSLVFLALSAFQSLLFIELIAHSERVTMSTQHKMTWSMMYNDWIAVFVPFFSDMSMYIMDYWTRQSWLENYYAGATTLTLAAAAVFWSRKIPIVGYHVLLALLGAALSMGHFSLIYGVLSKVFLPLAMIRYPIRFFYIFTFAVACLAGFGLDKILAINVSKFFSNSDKTGEHSIRLRIFSLLVCFFSIMVLVWSVFFDESFLKFFGLMRERYGETIQKYYTVGGFADNIYATMSNIRRSMVFFGLTSVAMAVAWSSRFNRRLLAMFFVILLFADLALCNPIEPRISDALMTKASTNVRVILSKSDQDPFRILASPMATFQQENVKAKNFADALISQKDRFISNSMMLYGFHDSLGYDSIYLREVNGIHKTLMQLKPSDPRHVLEQKDIARGSSLLNTLNIKYVVSPNPKLSKPFRLIHRTQGAYLYRNEASLPRAFLVNNIFVEKNRDRVLEKISANDFDPLETLYLEEDPGPEIGTTLKHSDGKLSFSGKVEDIDYGSQQVSMTVSVSEESSWLFFADSFYPGWVAEVDGKRTKIYKANHAFRAIRLTRGRHEILWRYDPVLFKAGSAVTLVTIMLLACYYFRRRNALV